MKAEEVIVKMAGTAPHLSNVGVRLMLHVIATAIVTGQDVITVTSRGSAATIGMSEDRMRDGVRNLARFIPVTIRDRRLTQFHLSSEWYDQQMRLPFDPQVYPQQLLCLQNPGTAARKSQALYPQNPGTDCPQNPGTVPGKARQSCGKEAVSARKSQAQCLGKPGTEADLPIRNAHARIESNRVEEGGRSAGDLVIEEAFHSVEIQPGQQQDAQILSEVILSHRLNFDSAAGASSQRDRKVIARLLAIAPIDRLCQVILQLNAEGLKPGKSDMWYFYVFFNRIHGIHHTVTDAVIKRQKSKAPPKERERDLFETELLEEISGSVRRIA